MLNKFRYIEMKGDPKIYYYIFRFFMWIGVIMAGTMIYLSKGTM